MNEPVTHRSELYLRFSRNSMIAALFVIAIMGSIAISLAIEPQGTMAGWLGRTGWLIPVVIVLLVTTLRSTLRGERWNPRSAETRAILDDEWRQTQMNRALKTAFVVVLIAQVPLALLVSTLPALHAVMAMAASTITLGLFVQIGLFLIFERD